MVAPWWVCVGAQQRMQQHALALRHDWPARGVRGGLRM
jgi:hypothetical protein